MEKFESSPLGAEASPAGRRSLHGRSKGKTLRAYHARLIAEDLPRLETGVAGLVSAAPLFARPVRELWLEIGFGGGEHLAARARENPEVGIIGCEPFINGVAKLLAAIDEEKLDNVRIRAGDARDLVESAPDGSFSRIFVLYPDPWPKRRQWKRRIVSEETIAQWARVLRPGGELRFATDIDDYAGWTLSRFLASPDFIWRAQVADDWRLPWEGWSPTRYEAKARAAGRPSAYLTFRRR
jgi:tRNA (guanine-N7-)-methyltransferase